MPTYCFVCEGCGRVKSVSRPMKDSNVPQLCECNWYMDRDYPAEHSSVRGDYNEPIISDAMAFDTVDLAEHRKRFPKIDVEVDHRSARPILRGLSAKRAYMKARGWIDQNSYV